MDLFPHLTRGGGEVAEGRQSPQGPKLTAPVPCPNSWFSLLGNGGFWGLSGKGVQPQLQACPPKLFSFLAPSPYPFGTSLMLGMEERGIRFGP